MRCSLTQSDERTAVVILRLRYLLDEEGAQNYAEEVVAAAFERSRRRGGMAGTLRIGRERRCQEETALALLSDARSSTNMPQDDQSRQVKQMLDALHAQRELGRQDNRAAQGSDSGGSRQSASHRNRQ